HVEGMRGRELNTHSVLQDLDRQLVALLPEHLALLLLDDRSRPVVGIDHLVADVVQARPPLAEYALPSRKPARCCAPAQGGECSRNGLTKPNLGQSGLAKPESRAAGS